MARGTRTPTALADVDTRARLDIEGHSVRIAAGGVNPQLVSAR
jgi:hypothetical protein